MDTIEASEKALFGLLKQLTPILGNDAFEKVSEDSFMISDRASPVPDCWRTCLVVYTPGQIEILRKVEDQFLVANSLKSIAMMVRGRFLAKHEANDNYCVLAQKGRPLQIFDAQLELKGRVELDEGKEIRQMEWQPTTNRLAILYKTVSCSSSIATKWNLDNTSFP